MRLRTQGAIVRELARVKRHIKRDDIDEAERREQYGAMQALEWALDNDAMAPSKLASTPETQ